MRERVTLTNNFSNGLVIGDTQAAKPPNSCEIATNVRVSRLGGLEQRLGSRRVSSAAFASTTNSLISWTRADGTFMAYVLLSDGSLHRATVSVLPVTWTSTAGAGSVGVISGYAVLNDTLYIADFGQLNKVSNADVFTANIAGTPTSVGHLVAYNQRLFGASSDRLYYSALDNGDTLGNTGSGGGEFAFRKPITGLAVVGSSLFVFHDDSISRFTGWGQSDFQVLDGQRGVTTVLGLSLSMLPVHPYRIAVKNRTAYFVTIGSGLVGVGEDGSVEYLSEALKQDHNAAPGNIGNQTLSVFAHPSRPELWVMGYGAVTYWVIHLPSKAWTKWDTTNMKLGHAIIVRPLNTLQFYLPRILTILEGDTWVREVEIAGEDGASLTKDNMVYDKTGGSDITLQVRTAALSVPDPYQVYAPRTGYLRYYTDGATVTATLKLHYDRTTLQLQALPATSFEQVLAFHAGKKGTRLQLEVEKTAGTGILRLSDISLELFAYGRRLARAGAV